jgi:hypothetical protein
MNPFSISALVKSICVCFSPSEIQSTALRADCGAIGFQLSLTALPSRFVESVISDSVLIGVRNRMRITHIAAVVQSITITTAAINLNLPITNNLVFAPSVEVQLDCDLL